MPTQVKKWGNSLAVRLPKDILRRLAIKEGSGVVMREERQAIVIRKQEPHDTLVGKNDWGRYLLPTNHKKENISGMIDTILYGTPR